MGRFRVEEVGKPTHDLDPANVLYHERCFVKTARSLKWDTISSILITRKCEIRKTRTMSNYPSYAEADWLLHACSRGWLFLRLQLNQKEGVVRNAHLILLYLFCWHLSNLLVT